MKKEIFLKDAALSTKTVLKEWLQVLLLKKDGEKRLLNFSADHVAWDLEAHYLSVALMDAILMISPEKIILGGGVMKQKQLFPIIRKKVQDRLNGYLNCKEILENIDEYIVYPGLGDNAGICGGFALALKRIKKAKNFGGKI